MTYELRKREKTLARYLFYGVVEAFFYAKIAAKGSFLIKLSCPLLHAVFQNVTLNLSLRP
jgi:hypothetical protein